MTTPETTPKTSRDAAATLAVPPPAPAAPAAVSAPWYSRFGNLAQIASAVIALVGFAVVIFQLNDNRKKSEAEAYRAELADARRNYATYSDAILRYPHLSDPDYAALMRNHNEYLRYQAFVSHMIYAYDDILNVVRGGGDNEGIKEWLTAFQVDIRLHRRYLCHPADKRFTETYRPFMQKLLKDAAGDCKDVPELVEATKPQGSPAVND
ncbi:hypothetical protein [Rhodoplanes sp. Z2-YC6860]|uniref:hypothetical protein n=1 Tax=Rhodoplanes sp. Z2-YC6860 TaxID=674703 RepID=UPI00078C1B03|nr:hypothetical protein [Rhodoplanes sp. Z2-YC6860]AMN42230.1 hypothetical protein RHPLAN_37980 [Rhodoplanes sp. Z2-YC6860]